MSRALTIGVPLVVGFPRVSGDEPLAPASFCSNSPFSPRERG